MEEQLKVELERIKLTNYICSLVCDRNQLKCNHNKLKVKCKTKDL